MPQLSGDLKSYSGITLMERTKSMLEKATKLGFTILPSVYRDKTTSEKIYNVFKCYNGKEEAYALIVKDWIKGFPRIDSKGNIKAK
jgi:hypothetical protein